MNSCGDSVKRVCYSKIRRKDRFRLFSSSGASNVYKRQMYHIVCGPRLHWLKADNEIEMRASKLQILNDEECNARTDICTGW